MSYATEMYQGDIERLEERLAVLIEALQTIADECDIEFQWASNVARGALERVGK